MYAAQSPSLLYSNPKVGTLMKLEKTINLLTYLYIIEAQKKGILIGEQADIMWYLLPLPKPSLES